MTRWAIGDVQGCYAELDELLQRIRFNADRDLLLFTGDLVNRGPQSLATLRRVRNLAANAIVVLGNHDLHLLAVAFVPDHRLRRSDTLDEVLDASDRDAAAGAGCSSVRSPTTTARITTCWCMPAWYRSGTHSRRHSSPARSSSALRRDPRALLSAMYGDEPDRWDESLSGEDRLRFIINVLTRVRVCTAQGRVDLRQKGPPEESRAPWMPWFKVKERASAAVRVIFGHWSTLGLSSRRRRAGPGHGLRLGRGAHRR